MTRFRESWRNLARITTVRVIAQTAFFVAFCGLILATTFPALDRWPALRWWAGKFLEIDPLVAGSTALATHSLYRGLIWSLAILLPTLFLGRFFCGWICPLGSLHHFVGWVTGRRTAPAQIAANSYKPSQRVKYYVLAGLLVAAGLGSLQIGLLDPLSLAYRSFTTAAVPATAMPLGVGEGQRLYAGAWLTGGLLLLFAGLNLVRPRFFCRVLCPLGALLGVSSRWGWWRIDRDPHKCNGCNRCRLSCEGACEPQDVLRKAECLVCFNCIEDCPEDALSFRFFPPVERAVAGPDPSRRRVLLAGLAGLAFYPLARLGGRNTRNFSSRVIRPPGSLEELEFLERCLKCAQCMRVCPTNVLQPAAFEAGLEGLWTPLLDCRVGHCQLNCTACGQVCPTGAIQRLSLEEKLGRGRFAAQGPVRLGTAHFDLGRCLPHSKNTPCVVCEEVCPTSPKAIYSVRELRPLRDARRGVVSADDSGLTLDGPAPQWPSLLPAAAGLVVRYSGAEAAVPFVTVEHPDGTRETQRIVGTQEQRLRIAGKFARTPAPGTSVLLQVELRMPRMDLAACIGCGLCERECPVVGDRRAVYVTAEGETRSRAYPQRDRNRSARLL